MADLEWVAIGRLMKVRGNRGELLAELDSADPEREQKLEEVALSKDGKHRKVRVENAWRHDGRPVLKFEGIDSISDAEVWERAEILVPREEVEVPEEGGYSHETLVGCRVETTAGELVGEVKAVEEFGGPPLLNLEMPDGREVLVPFARSICKKIDVDAKVIQVELPEGLIELQ